MRTNGNRWSRFKVEPDFSKKAFCRCIENHRFSPVFVAIDFPAQ